MSFLSQFLSYSSHIVSLAGNTAGTLAAISTGTMILAGGNNITLSQNGQSITISGGAAGGGFSAGVSGGNTTGSTGATGSRLVFAGGNNITLSQSTDANGGTITVSAFNQSLQPSSNFSAGVSGGNTAGSTGATGSRLVLAGGNNITLSQSTDANGGTVTVSAFNQLAESNTAGISNLGNTAGTSGVISGNQIRLLLAGGNNVTLSQSVNGASATITVSAFNQTSQSNTLGMSNLGNTSGTSGVISGPGLQMLLAGGNNITLSQSINGSSATITISAGAAGGGAGTNTLGMSNLGNTSGTSGVISGSALQLALAGGNNITLSQSINGSSATITISAFTQSAESQSHGMSNLGNTSGTTGMASGNQVRYVMVGGNNITLSQSLNGASGTLTISAANQTVESQSIGMSNLGNTAGTTGMASGGQVQFAIVGGNNITLSQSINGASGTITISGNAGSGGGGTLEFGAFVYPASGMSTQTLGVGTLNIWPMSNQANLTASYMAHIGSVGVGTSTNASVAATLGISFGLYTRNGSTLSLASSGAQAWNVTNTSNNSVASLTGYRLFTVPINVNATPGVYWLAFLSSSATAGSNSITISNLANVSQFIANPQTLGHFGSATNNTVNYIPGFGRYSTTTAALPASIAFSQISFNNRSVWIPVLQLGNFTA